MDLSDLKPSPGSKRKKKRESRGRAGYGGKTAGRGHNGQKQRAGCSIRKQFEGGQTPLYRRLPKHQYISTPNKKSYTIINLADIESLGFDKEIEVTPELLLESKVIKKLENGGLKILANGDLKTPLKIKAHAFSSSAETKVSKAGGSLEKIS
ncbi:MAG: 50S ribosomal protein L15 [Candidatus Caenarcaniphilales bacterium]|nr:50S ribosomal protein L15 [Candidatus Caenarcaniphilales bacterium]